ncbi:MAG: AAA family ATPase [Candidatus Saccharibacteria bacterium]
MLPKNYIEESIKASPVNIDLVWQEATRLASKAGSHAIEPVHIVTALILTCPSMDIILKQMKLQKSDVEEVSDWFDRLIATTRSEKPYFGGIGRDWAFGFTNQLNRLGYNISQGIENGGGYFSWLTNSPGVEAMTKVFSSGSTAIALVGNDGVGKTSHVYALAQALLEGGHGDKSLDSYQVVELKASSILSNAKDPAHIENMIISLISEASHSGHIILFLDDAQQFFSQGVGRLDITQILLQVVQSKSIRLILAFNTHDFQAIKSTHSALATQLSPVVLNEPNEVDTIRILEDTAIGLEHKNNVVISHDALKTAYNLSGRYEQELAYPGKAIQLVSQAVSYAQDGIVSAASVQGAIEKTHGVKVGTASTVEASDLLNLEAKIHERMVNQDRAVGVVSNALRRARAGRGRRSTTLW